MGEADQLETGTENQTLTPIVKRRTSSWTRAVKGHCIPFYHDVWKLQP